MLEEGELRPATLAILLAALEREAYQHLAFAVPLDLPDPQNTEGLEHGLEGVEPQSNEDRVFRSLPDSWQLHRAVWHRQVLKVATLPQLSWRAAELHLALRF